MIHLRIRTEYSFGETFAPISRVISRLKAIGATAAGIVDPGTWGHVPWDTACRKAGIQPLFGVRLGVVPSLETEDRPEMWFLALTSEGLSDLYRFSSLAQRQSLRGTPRLTHDQVRGMGAGIEKFAGAVLDSRLLRDINAVLDTDIGSPVASRRKLKLARELGLRVVAVGDNAFPAPEDRSAFDMIARSGAKPTPQHIPSWPDLATGLELGSAATILAATAAEIAKKAEGVVLRTAPLIKVEGDLEGLCREGILLRGLPWSEEYETRLMYELGLIREKEFESYFLMVADMVHYAKSRMLVGPSRGSAAGSLVCYLAKITEVDPIPNGLFFERFIDITRKDLPDIDLDFPDAKRHLVLEYLREKYGERNVAQIGTISTYQPKSALIAVAKRLNIPPWETNAVKDALFERSSGDSRANFALLDTLEQTDPGRKLLSKHPAMRLAADIEAHASHTGVHAAGILVCNEAIENFCTVTADGIAQLDKKDAEKLNLLKIDVLGLRTLGVLEDSGIPVDWYNLKMDDPAVWEVFNDHRYAGIFQFEGQSLQSVCGQMKITSLEDLGHVTALARPGPMASGGTTAFLLRRAGKEPITIPHPAIAKYVKDTYGVVVYQEQVLNICREIGLLEWGDTTTIRKAMSKTMGEEFMDQFRQKFITGAATHGINKHSANAIWEMINTMGSWAFNLAHSYSYAVVSYWTAHLKAHHLLEFSAATLRNVKSEESAIALLRELKREGVDYVPFDAHLSEVNWSVKNGQLLGGFTGLKGIGESKAKAIIAEREANAGQLSAEALQKLAEHECTFSDLFPTESRFGDWYTNPQVHGIRPGTKLTRIAEIQGESDYVYIGRLKGKDLRDYNEAIRIKRRNGKRYEGQTLFLDLDIEDDTGKILTRIDRHDFEKMGREIWDSAKINSWWLIRGQRKLWGKPESGFKMIYVDKIKPLEA